jgi:hypothetical protein
MSRAVASVTGRLTAARRGLAKLPELKNDRPQNARAGPEEAAGALFWRPRQKEPDFEIPIVVARSRVIEIDVNERLPVGVADSVRCE